jgi:hypothetical protein
LPSEWLVHGNATQDWLYLHAGKPGSHGRRGECDRELLFDCAGHLYDLRDDQWRWRAWSKGGIDRSGDSVGDREYLGRDTFSGIANCSYTVTPSKTGFTFTPANQAVTISGANVIANFSSTAVQTFTISGTISGAGGSGARVT